MHQHIQHRRRRFIAAGAGLIALALAATTSWAQAPAPPAAPSKITAVGVFALLGESLQIAQAGDITDSRLDRTLRDSLPVKNIGFDQAALRAVRTVLGQKAPAAQMQMFLANTALSPADQRALADGATRAELPAWIVSAIQAGKLSHILLITRGRGDASFPLSNGFDIGRGKVEGIGYYVDAATEVKNIANGNLSTGFLGAYVQLRLQLMDAQSGDIVGSQDVRVGRIHLANSAGGAGNDGANIWKALGPVQKVDLLRSMVETEVARVLPALLAGG